MKNLSIKHKSYLIFCVLFLVIFFSGAVILYSLSNAREDEEIMNALGLQRMFSHQMAQSVFGFSMAKSQEKTMVQKIKSLDDYITQMRKIYTESVIDQVDKVGMAISMDPSSEPHPAISFPATFTRMVNEKFGDKTGLTVSIISETPVNPDQNLKSDLDKEANAFLKKSPNETFSKIFEENGKLYMGLYTPDKATASACVSCHSALQNKKVKLGDILGIRRYKLVYSEDVAFGKEELNATLIRYITAHKFFHQTLSAMKSGGELLLDPLGTIRKKISALSDIRIQGKIVEIEKKLYDLEESVKTLLNLEMNSLPYRQARQKIISETKMLRDLSQELVVLYGFVAKRHHKNIQLAVVTAGTITLLMLIGLASYIARVVVEPIQKISKVLTETVKGNLKQKELPVNSKDEIGVLNQSCNELTGGLQRFIRYSEDIHNGKFQTDRFDLEGDFITSLEKIKATAKAKQRAEKELQEAKVGLESRVKERTSELLQSNKNLKQEISRRIKSDQALLVNEIQKNRILDNLTDGIITINEEGIIQSFSKGAQKIFGYNESETLGKNVKILMPEPFESEHDQYIKNYIKTGISKIIGIGREVLGLRKNGTTLELDLRISEMYQGENRFFTGIIRDITEEKFMQARLNQAQKMESIGQLAAGIAHEINTPMQFIGDNTRFLKNSFHLIFKSINAHDRLRKEYKRGRVSEKMFDEVEVFLETNEIDYLSEEIPLAIAQSLEGVKRVTNIVEAMKEFSHPGSEGKVPTDINQAIESTLAVAKNEWKYIAEVVKDFDSNLPLVPCLLNDFNQVILNAVINAAHAIEEVVKNSGEKGTITISTRKDEDWVEIRIKDTGPGIPEDIRSKIFDLFFTTKEVGKGTGQGLAIIHSIMVNKHNGTVDLETEMGKGTSFIFRLPIFPKIN